VTAGGGRGTRKIRMPEWRRNIIPACPVCGRAADVAIHKRGCGNGEWWIDLETGNTQCGGCGEKASVETMRHFCDCGAVYEGGELWQGMAAEIVDIGELHWFRAAGIRRGDLTTRFLGWSECTACGAKTEGMEYYFGMWPLFSLWEIKRGGLCDKCKEKARKRLAAWWSPWISDKECRWCGGYGGEVRIVRVGRVRICRTCFHHITGILTEEKFWRGLLFASLCAGWFGVCAVLYWAVGLTGLRRAIFGVSVWLNAAIMLPVMLLPVWWAWRRIFKRGGNDGGKG
jgi:hypothetical protein